MYSLPRGMVTAVESSENSHGQGLQGFSASMDRLGVGSSLPNGLRISNVLSDSPLIVQDSNGNCHVTSNLDGCPHALFISGQRPAVDLHVSQFTTLHKGGFALNLAYWANRMRRIGEHGATLEDDCNAMIVLKISGERKYLIICREAELLPSEIKSLLSGTDNGTQLEFPPGRDHTVKKQLVTDLHQLECAAAANLEEAIGALETLSLQGRIQLVEASILNVEGTSATILATEPAPLHSAPDSTTPTTIASEEPNAHRTAPEEVVVVERNKAGVQFKKSPPKPHERNVSYHHTLADGSPRHGQNAPSAAQAHPLQNKSLAMPSNHIPLSLESRRVPSLPVPPPKTASMLRRWMGCSCMAPDIPLEDDGQLSSTGSVSSRLFQNCLCEFWF